MAIKKVVREIEIGELFQLLNIKGEGEYEAPKTLKVYTPNGFKKVEGLKKTKKNPEWEIKTKTGTKACFTDFHQIEVDSKEDIIEYNKKWKYVKNLKIGDKINTINGFEEIKEVYFNGKYSNMYDLQVEEVRCFYTNKIVSHNSIFLGNFAVNAFLQGKNVLIYTLEMSQEKLAGRIYSNIFEQTRISMLADPDAFKEKLKNFNKNGGSLIIKEYPSSTASANDFMAHINDLKMYRNWTPDIIFIDYLLIMTANDKTLSSSESYQYFKAITIEARNISKILNIPVVSATQLNRGAQQEGKAGSKNTVTSQSLSESRAILDNTDFLFTIIQNENDKKQNQITLFSDKARDEANNIRLRFKMDYEHMKVLVWEPGRE